MPITSLRQIVDRLGARRPCPGLVYRPGEPQRCPGCGARAWYVRRVTAECVRCHHALPLASPTLNGAGNALEGEF